VRLAILSRGDGWHVQDLLRAAGERGIAATALDFRTIHDRTLEPFDAAIVRTMPAGSLEQIVLRMDLLQAAFERGMPVRNAPKACEACVDKFLTTLRLQRAGLPTPATHACQRADDAMAIFGEFDGDAVVKPLFGAEGRGIVRVTDPDLAWRTFHAIEQTHGAIYVQRFVRHPGWDVRAFVLGGRVIAAMKRSNRLDWRTNVARGGTTEPFALAPAEVDLALAATQAVGADYAGVDLVRNDAGEWLVIEVNAVPGWRALAATCGIDVATRVIDDFVGVT
jgi:ribosomal protein S6--L-glutamate ligase